MMKPLTPASGLLTILLIALSTPLQAIEVEELVRHFDRLWRGETSHAEMSMTVGDLAPMIPLYVIAWRAQG